MAAYSACLPTLGPLEKLATDSESEVGVEVAEHRAPAGGGQGRIVCCNK